MQKAVRASPEARHLGEEDASLHSEYILTLSEAERDTKEWALVAQHVRNIRDTQHGGDTHKLFDALDHTGSSNETVLSKICDGKNGSG